jgi:hypothetical protein
VDIKKATDSELEKELERRKKEKESLKTPVPLKKPDFTRLISTCQHNIKEIGEGRSDTDTAHYIYEEAMTAVYGKDVWKWVNAKL